MRILSALVLVSTMLAATGPASAAQGGGARRIKVAVLDVKAVGAVDPKAIEGLSSLIGSEVAQRQDLSVIASADLRTMVGFERERALMGCNDTSCLAEIGGALGVDYLVASEGSKVGKTWLLSFSLLEVAKARSLKRLTKRTASDNELVDLTVEAVQELVAALPKSLPAARATVATSESKAAEVPQTTAARPAAESEAAASAPVQAKRFNWLTFGLVSGGIVTGIVGTLMLGSSRGTYDRHINSTISGQPDVTWEEAQSATSQAKVGVGLMTVGVGVLGWGVKRLIWPGTSSSEVAFSGGPSSAGVSYAGVW